MTTRVSGGGGGGYPGVTPDGFTPGGLNVAGVIQTGSIGTHDATTQNDFAGGVIVRDQGVSVVADLGNDAVFASVTDGFGVTRLCFRTNADETRMIHGGITPIIADVDGVTITNKLRVGTSVIHTLGSYSGKAVPVYDVNGVQLGFMPLYA